MRFIACLSAVCVALIGGGLAEAANRTVCASGCQYTSLQVAIDAAVPGDTILLRAGQTFVGNVVLRNKNTSSTQFITIRSDAADSGLPAAGVRLIPEGQPGANTARSKLARLIGSGGTLKSTAVVKAADGAHHYRLQFLEIDGTANVGYETLVYFGSPSSTSLSALPHTLVMDRVWLHGHPVLGMKRGLYLNSRSTDILNSYFDGFFSVNEGQAILATNGPGPYKILNNHLEATGENIMIGGQDPRILNLVPSDIEIRGNYFYKDPAWRNPALKTPGKPLVSVATTTGSVGSGTQYFKVAAIMDSGGAVVLSAGSVETAVSAPGGKAIKLSWSGVSNATRYRIYRGTASNKQAAYLDTTGTSTSFTYTGVSEKAGTPRSTGQLWTVKNLFELKNAQRVKIDGNLFEYNWQAGQQGHAILFTPNQYTSGKAPWTVVRDIQFINNVVRHVAAGFLVNGHDYDSPEGQLVNLVIRNNLFQDVSSKWGNTGRWLAITEAPANVTVDHNTIDHTGQLVEFDHGAVMGFVFTNNMARHNAYGIYGSGYAPGNKSFAVYTPDLVFKANVLAGGSASSYPSGNYFPTAASFLTNFVSPSTGDYRLALTSLYNNKGTDGKDIGADFAGLQRALAAGTSAGVAPIPTDGGSGSDPTDPASTNQPPVARAGGPYSVAAGAALTVNGGGSTDAEAPLVRYDWHFREDIVLRAADVPAANIKGRWRKVSTSGAAGGVALENPNAGEAKKSTALASPANYVDITFEAGSGVPYHVWLRMKAAGDSSANDSVYVQFDNSVNAAGTATYRIGTTSGMPAVLEKCDGAGRSGWGWNDSGWCAEGAPVYFKTAGPQKLRIQQREDGIMIDQIVISAAAYATKSPGTLKVDTTIVPATLGSDTGITAVHTYKKPGVYPVRLWVTDSVGQEASAATTATVTATSASVSAPEVVLHAADVPSGDIHGRWTRVAVSSAAEGISLENANRNEAKRTTALASPVNFVDLRFNAAAGVPYSFWMRMRADDDHYANDSVHVQFSGAVTVTGTSKYRIGTTSSMAVVLEDCDGAGRRGWGWNDGGWCGVGQPIYFQTTGAQTVRVQQREDGVMFDHIVLSPDDYVGAAPGDLKNDATILDDGSL